MSCIPVIFEIIQKMISGHFGWRGIFVFGGVLSTLMIPLVMWRLPESLDFLVSKRPKGALQLANALLRRIGRPALDELPEVTETKPKGQLRDIIKGGLLQPTLLLWTAFFFVMFSFYFVVSWTPKLLVQAGLDVSSGISGGVLLNLGGICGTVLLGVLSARFGIFRLHTTALVASALTIAGFGIVSASLYAALTIAVLVGFFLFTAMVGLYVVTPSIYPTEVRNTGTGLAIGVGRMGAILSPYLAGLLLEGGWQPDKAYVVFSLPMLLAAGAIAWLARRHRMPSATP